MTPDNLEHLRLRLYVGGFKPRDFAELKPGIVIVEPLKPPEKTAGGLYTGPEAANVPGTACYFFRVVATATMHPPDVLEHKVGDVVALRQAHLDPLDAKQSHLSIKSEHLLSRWPDDFVEEPLRPPPALLVPDTRLVRPE